jgi:hypothetical protein
MAPSAPSQWRLTDQDLLDLRHHPEHHYNVFAKLFYCLIKFTLGATGDEKTYAPSDTKRRAVASPIPLVPPAMTAIFPSSLLIYFSSDVIFDILLYVTIPR